MCVYREAPSPTGDPGCSPGRQLDCLSSGRPRTVPSVGDSAHLVASDSNKEPWRDGMGGMTSIENNDKNPSPPVSESNAGAVELTSTRVAAGAGAGHRRRAL